MQIQLPAMPPIVVQWITPEAHFYAQWNFWLSVFTLLLVVATFLLVLETRSMRTSSDTSMRDMLKHAEASADAARRSANAAEVSADASKKSVELGNRAWVHLSALSMPDGSDLKQPYNVAYTIVNAGSTPAFDLTVTPALNVFEDNIPDILRFISRAEASSYVLGPGNPVNVGNTVHLTPKQIDDIYNRRSYLISYAVITYTDVFKQEHSRGAERPPPQERHRWQNYQAHQLSAQSGQALLGGEALRLDEIGRAVAEGEVTRPRQAVVVVHLHCGDVHLWRIPKLQAAAC
jgi:hypothetical protein